MRYLSFFILLLLNVNEGISQNLVPNHSFENTSGSLSVNDGFYNRVLDWSSFLSVDYHYGSLGGANPDLIYGYQMPYSGTAMAGIRAYHGGESEWHEFIHTRIDFPLDSNRLYKVSFQVSPSEGSRYSSDDIGLCLTDVEPITYFDYPNDLNLVRKYYEYKPQIENLEGHLLDDADIWYELSGEYRAKGNEVYLIIGNFKPDSLTTLVETWNGDKSPYYFIDNVVVEPCPVNIRFDFLKDTLLCEGDTFKIDASHPSASYLWQDGSTDSNYNITESGIYTVQISAAGCTDSKSIEVIVTPDLSFGTEITSCKEQKVTINASSTLNQNRYDVAYQWSTGSIDSIVTFDKSGVYWGERTVGHCVSRDSITINYINELTTVFPNPSSGDFTIQSSLNPITHYRLYNTAGQLLVDENNNGHTVDFSFEGRAIGGLYLLEVETGGCSVEKKVIVH